MELTKQVLREVMEHERRCAASWPRVSARAGTQTRTLIESLDGAPARPPVPEAVERLIREVEAEFAGHAVVLDETRADSRPTSAAKASTRPATTPWEAYLASLAAGGLSSVSPLDDRPSPAARGGDQTLQEAPRAMPENVHARMAAAIRGEAFVELPAGIHRQFAEALIGSGPAPAIPEGAHVKLMEALTGQKHVELPEGIHAKFARAIRGW